MQLIVARLGGGSRVGLVRDGRVRLLKPEGASATAVLTAVLHAADPATAAEERVDPAAGERDLAGLDLLPPIDRQEVWAAGVTYKRSEEARKRESVGAAQFYDKVYTADRPELFFKSTPDRVVGPGDGVRVRRDSRWSVPEPELALVIAPDLRVVGYTIGNDMSARDIEGENPLYLPQAKVYDRSCAMGPAVTLAGAMPPLPGVGIRLRIARGGAVAFEGSTNVGMMKRAPQELVGWLGKEQSFPNGAVLFTGTGVVPPDEFTLAVGDEVAIEVDGVGRLVNPVV